MSSNGCSGYWLGLNCPELGSSFFYLILGGEDGGVEYDEEWMGEWFAASTSNGRKRLPR